MTVVARGEWIARNLGGARESKVETGGKKRPHPLRPSPREAGAGGTSSGVSYKWGQDKEKRGGKGAGPPTACLRRAGRSALRLSSGQACAAFIGHR